MRLAPLVLPGENPRMNVFLRLAVLSTLVLTGCATNDASQRAPAAERSEAADKPSPMILMTQRATSGLVGCPPHEVRVSNYTYGWATAHSWQAECRGQLFYCSSVIDLGAYCARAREQPAQVNADTSGSEATIAPASSEAE